MVEEKPVKVHSGGKPRRYESLEGDLKFTDESTGEIRTLHYETPVEYHTTSTEINPLKFSFGKVVFSQLTFEAYIYPLENLNFVGGFPNASFKKVPVFVFDLRRSTEFYSLLSKIRYFQRLTMQRKLEYLQKQGYFANINITTIEERAKIHADKRGLDMEKVFDAWSFNYMKYKEMLQIE